MSIKLGDIVEISLDGSTTHFIGTVVEALANGDYDVFLIEKVGKHTELVTMVTNKFIIGGKVRLNESLMKIR